MIKLLLFLIIPLTSLEQTVDDNHQLLWEISGNGLEHNSYLFGSFHSNDKRLFNLSDSTFYALNSAELIALETDVFSLFDSWDTRTTLVQIKYDNEGEPYVSNADATETYYGSEDGMPQFLDAFFQQYCHNSDKRFHPLESVDFQLGLLSEVDAFDYGNIHLESLFLDKEDMLEMYLKGDIYKLDQMLRSSLAIYPQGYQKLITQRNFKMASGIDSLVRKGHVIFCAVGAGHLAGGSGIINLLRSKGYSLRTVAASYSDVSTPDRTKVLSNRSYDYDNDTLGLHIRFPGKPKLISSSLDEFDLKLVYRDFGQGNSFEVEIYPRTEEIGLQQLAEIYIASPEQSPAQRIQLDNGGEAWEGLADSYPEGLYWTRVIMNEEYFVIIKASGGNKFMNSKRAQRFFEGVWLN